MSLSKTKKPASWIDSTVQETLPTGLNMLDKQQKADPLLPEHNSLYSTASVNSTKQSICIDMLCDGQVNSFVDFFYLTHRTEDKPNSKIAEIPDSQLPLLQHHLTTAETAQRHSDSNKVLESYEKLAIYFQEKPDYKTSVYFHEKCLDVAEATGNLGQQGIANNNLGVTHDAMGDLATAIAYHEQHLYLANVMGDNERIIYVSKQLADIYMRYADSFSTVSVGPDGTTPSLSSEQLANSIKYYEKCLCSALECNDSVSESQAAHKLGNVCSQAGQSNDAIAWQEKCLSLCDENKDALGQANASLALAVEYDKKHDLKKAALALERAYDIGSKNNMTSIQVDACCKLGEIATRTEQFDKAVAYFEKAFELSKSINDRKSMDLSRIQLGMARGNLSYGRYMDTVNNNVDTLLKMKTIGSRQH